MAGHWLVQANPKTWDVVGAVDARPVEAWCVSRYLGRLTSGDDVGLWVSGRKAGVYAIGEVTGDAGLLTDDLAAAAQVPIRFDVLLRSDPVPKAELVADPRFARSLILRMPGGGNPFPLTDDEWSAIADRLPSTVRRS